MQNKKYKQTFLTDKYNERLHHGASSTIFKNAASLRASTTKAEKLLWSKLRNKQLKGKKFRRQHPLSMYILDFYCHECKLVVELDGNFHNEIEQKKYDEERTKFLNELGIKVLRFWNHEVINETQKVLDKIAEYLK